MIRGYILVHPGDSYTDIKQNLKLSSGALTYHLDVLEREKLVKSQNRGSRKLCSPAGVPVPEDGGGLHELQLRMLKGRGGAAGDPAAGPRGDPGGEPGARPVPPAHAPDAAVGGDAARRAVHPGVRRGGGGAEGGHVRSDPPDSAAPHERVGWPTIPFAAPGSPPLPRRRTSRRGSRPTRRRPASPDRLSVRAEPIGCARAGLPARNPSARRSGHRNPCPP